MTVQADLGIFGYVWMSSQRNVTFSLCTACVRLKNTCAVFFYGLWGSYICSVTEGQHNWFSHWRLTEEIHLKIVSWIKISLCLYLQLALRVPSLALGFPANRSRRCYSQHSLCCVNFLQAAAVTSKSCLCSEQIPAVLAWTTLNQLDASQLWTGSHVAVLARHWAGVPHKPESPVSQ